MSVCVSFRARAAICSPRLPIMAHVISHVVVLPTDLERFEPRLLLATECFVSLFSALHVDLQVWFSRDIFFESVPLTEACKQTCHV